MKEKNHKPGRWSYWIAVLPVLVGALVAALLFRNSGVGIYPVLISNAYEEEQHHLNVPGSTDVKLTRTGAYGIYYEHSLVDSRQILAPAIDCSLTSKSKGVKLEAVPDYVETNRYWFKEQGGSGVLVMSITVNNPDTYTFACHYQDGSAQPEITVALGPNYFWEFLSVASKISLPLLGMIGVLCGSFLLALIIAIGVAIKRAAI